VNDVQQKAVLFSLVKHLRSVGSWCGETHVQKTAYFLQGLHIVPLDFEFVLYKHGPYSFDLSDALTEMRAEDLLKLEPKEYPYGPSFAPGRGGEQIIQRFPRTVSKYEPQVTFVAEKLGDKNVAELERLATALYVTKREGLRGVEPRAKRINELKPHIPAESAQDSVIAVDRLIEEASRLQPEAIVG
jgi:hypothetical protein